jgi:hypothetical protein
MTWQRGVIWLRESHIVLQHMPPYSVTQWKLVLESADSCAWLSCSGELPLCSHGQILTRNRSTVREKKENKFLSELLLPSVIWGEPKIHDLLFESFQLGKARKKFSLLRSCFSCNLRPQTHQSPRFIWHPQSRLWSRSRSRMIYQPPKPLRNTSPRCT